jgi:CHAT domain-containing protein/Tfp pilus assembly protein PilF
MFQQVRLSAARCGAQLKFISKILTLFSTVWLLSEMATAAQAQAGTGAGATAQSDSPIVRLEHGKPVDRELAGGQTHAYKIMLAAGQYARVIVDQRGIDVVVALFGPDDKQIVKLDRYATRGLEPVTIVTDIPAIFRLEVSSLQKNVAAGRYVINVAEMRIATTQDRGRVAAQTAYAEAERLHQQGVEESLRKAIGKAEEAIALWRAGGDRDGETETFIKIGLLYRSLGENRKALDYYNQALPLAQTLIDRYAEARVLNNIGVVYSNLGAHQKAIECYERALTLEQANSNRQAESTLFNNLALDWQFLGELQKALDYLNKSLALKRVFDDRRGEANTLANIGALYSEMGETQIALDYYNQALPLRRAVNDRPGEASTLNNIGSIYKLLGENQKALDYFSQALPLWRAAGSRQGEARTLGNMATVYILLGENPKALEHFAQSLSISRIVGDRQAEGAALSYQGDVYASMGENKKALDDYREALAVTRAIKNRRQEASILNGIARVERNQGNLNEARINIENTINIVESLRTSIVSKQLRASYFASVQKYYSFYIDLLMQIHKQRPAQEIAATALQANERARARSLIELLSEASADIRQGVDPALLERERSLQQRLTTREGERIRLLNGKHAKEQADALEKDIGTLANEYQEVEAQIRAASPRYAALTQPQPLTLSEIQQNILDADTLLLEYALGDQRSYLWAVSQSTIISYELPRRAEIESAARRFYEFLTAPNQPGRAAEQGRTLGKARSKAKTEVLHEAASALSQMLLAPVASELGTKRLIVVSDGALQYIPFAALPIPVVDGHASAGAGKTTRNIQLATQRYRPLIVDHEIISLPSASTLAVLRRELAGRNPAPNVAAVLADPVFEATDLRVKRGAQNRLRPTGAQDPDRDTSLAQLLTGRALNDAGLVTSGKPIPRLPYSRLEAAAIKSLVPEQLRKLATGFSVTHRFATSPELGNYQIVHFATHGLLNSKQPELSGILLSLVDEQGNPKEKGILRLGEIYNLRLPAELVVLSACQTALGKEVKGEGLVGLTRGFMYSGAARVVASLWKVNDKATAELMKIFYEGVLGAKRLRPPDALRRAQIKMWKTSLWRAPYYWGAFTLQGEWK